MRPGEARVSCWSGCAVLFLPVPAVAVTVAYAVFGGLAWMTAAALWGLWLWAAWATERGYRRVLAAARAAEAARAQALPRRVPAHDLAYLASEASTGELAALDGAADLKAAVWSTMAGEEAL